MAIATKPETTNSMKLSFAAVTLTVALFSAPSLIKFVAVQIEHLNLFCTVEQHIEATPQNPAVQKAFDQLAARHVAFQDKMDQLGWK